MIVKSTVLTRASIFRSRDGSEKFDEDCVEHVDQPSSNKQILKFIYIYTHTRSSTHNQGPVWLYYLNNTIHISTTLKQHY